jgi:hypothetical protein
MADVGAKPMIINIYGTSMYVYQYYDAKISFMRGHQDELINL